MPQPTLIEADRVAPQPWRNGGGATRELYVWPPQGDWQLRISLADIEQDGPFSAFPGVQRHFAVLEGEGVALRFDGSWREQTRASPPLAFDGALAPDCRLLAGATRDLNLMCRGGLVGQMRVATAGPRPRSAGDRLALFCTAAATLNVGGQAQRLAPRSLLIDVPADAELLDAGAAPAFWIPWSLLSPA